MRLVGPLHGELIFDPSLSESRLGLAGYVMSDGAASKRK